VGGVRLTKFPTKWMVVGVLKVMLLNEKLNKRLRVGGNHSLQIVCMFRYVCNACLQVQNDCFGNKSDLRKKKKKKKGKKKDWKAHFV
jgi:hypothetical protein